MPTLAIGILIFIVRTLVSPVPKGSIWIILSNIDEPLPCRLTPESDRDHHSPPDSYRVTISDYHKQPATPVYIRRFAQLAHLSMLRSRSLQPSSSFVLPIFVPAS